MGQETWRHSSVQYKFKTEKLCMVSNCLSAKNLHTKNKNMCDNVSPMGDTSLTSHFILKELKPKFPFHLSASCLLSSLQNYTTSHASVSSLISLPEKLS